MRFSAGCLHNRKPVAIACGGSSLWEESWFHQPRSGWLWAYQASSWAISPTIFRRWQKGFLSFPSALIVNSMGFVVAHGSTASWYDSNHREYNHDPAVSPIQNRQLVILTFTVYLAHRRLLSLWGYLWLKTSRYATLGFLMFLTYPNFGVWIWNPVASHIPLAHHENNSGTSVASDDLIVGMTWRNDHFPRLYIVPTS